MGRESVCGRCHMLVATYAPQVTASGMVYHRDCYEAWYFNRYGRRPALMVEEGQRQRFTVRALKS